MATVDELLNTIIENEVCLIDPDTRRITVPACYAELGVESDEKVSRINFQCPRIVGDNIDLTTFNLYINYLNGGGQGNIYLIDDITISGDNITFSWLLSRHVTEKSGSVKYIVCAKKSDSAGVTNEWNTKVATGLVNGGLEVVAEIEEQNADIIEQILVKLSDSYSKSETDTLLASAGKVKTVNGVEPDANGNIEIEGGNGKDGTTFTPSVSADGTLSWTNDGGKDNPASVNIKGADGAKGADGTNGKDGTSVTVASVSESTTDGGSNVVTFSDGKTVTIKNGSKGSTGNNGKTPVKGTDYWTDADKSEIVEDTKNAVDLSSYVTAVQAETLLASYQQKSTLETDVAAKGFTKNTGTYSKPSSGIPKSDLASDVQTSLSRADTLTDAYINNLINTAVGVIENGSY